MHPPPLVLSRAHTNAARRRIPLLWCESGRTRRVVSALNWDGMPTLHAPSLGAADLISPHFAPSQDFADSLAVPFLETSAKSATNVEQAFMTMASEIKNRMATAPTAKMGNQTVRRAIGPVAPIAHAGYIRQSDGASRFKKKPPPQ